MKRIFIDRKRYLMVAAHRRTVNPCSLCHFREASAGNIGALDECPRQPTVVGGVEHKTVLVCVHNDEFDSAHSAYLIRDTKQGRAEWIARKLEA